MNPYPDDHSDPTCPCRRCFWYSLLFSSLFWGSLLVCTVLF